MATPAASQAQSQVAQREKFTADKTVHGGITYMTLGGTLNVDFIGKRVAKSIKSSKIVINMRRVRRFASWGMTEWMDFLRLNAERDLYIVECSPYALSQLNLITGLLGHAKLVSYYASARCSGCGEEIETQFIIPRDRDLIASLPRNHLECPTCGGQARLEEYPAAFFETIADRPAFDIDDEVLAFFRSNLGYQIEPDLDRFRAHRATKNRYTYLRLGGNIAALPDEVLARVSSGVTIVDLERVKFEPHAIAAWDVYVASAMDKVDSLQLLHCPPGFLEHAVSKKFLKQKLKVRTFLLNYDCAHCERTSTHVVDVADNLEYLAEGTTPTVQCPTCRASLVAAVSMDLAMLLRTLPARERDPALDTFIEQSRKKPIDKLENTLTATASAAEAAPAAGGKGAYIALALASALVVGLGVVGFIVWRDSRQETKVVAGTPTTDPQQPPPPTFTRPEWIVSQVPSSAYCHDMINRVMCVGVSAYRPTKEDGLAEASDAALEELVNAVALKITAPEFRDTVLPQYSEARAKQLSTLQSADLDRKTDPAAATAFTTADEVVRKARKRVVESLQASGGAAVPTQRSDWYWEEYATETGKPNEVLVFVRYDISLDAMRTLVETYSTTAVVKGTTAMTAFPALGWRYGEFAGGVLLTKLHRKLVSAGLAPLQLVTAVDAQHVADVGTFARYMNDARDDVKLTIVADDKSKVVPVRL